MHSLNSCLNADPLSAVALAHKFNDHNSFQLDAKEQLRQKLGALSVNKVYRVSLSLAALQFRLGHLDAALEAVQEATRIAQNKNDFTTVLDCAVWLYVIQGALGNRKQEKQLLEHVVHQANKVYKN